MGLTLLIALTAWFGLNAAVVAAVLRRAPEHADRRLRGRRRRSLAAPVDGYGSLLLSRLVVHACRVTGAPTACLLVRGKADPDALVPVAAHGLDEELIGRPIDPAGPGWRIGPIVPGGRGRSSTNGVAVPVLDRAGGDCGYLWVNTPLGDRQTRLLAELAELTGRALDDLRELRGGAGVDEAIGRALARVAGHDDASAAGRHAALARAVGARLGLDAAALIELDVAARVQHAVRIAPAGAVADQPGMEAVTVVLRFARERWDGGGPHGLRGERIPLGSRILAACESAGVPFDDTLRAIQGASGSRFDPAVVTALSQELLGPWPELAPAIERWAEGDRMFAV